MLENLGGDLRLDFYHGRIFFFQPYPELPIQKYHGVKIMQ
jgi:hypothetical protein